MFIKQFTIYTLGKKEFKSFDEIKIFIENKLGGIIDSIQPRLPTKQKLDLLSLLIQNRYELADLLTAVYIDEEGKERNIFDYE